MKGRAIVLALVAAVIHFISCSGGPGQPRQLAEIPVPNNPSSPSTSATRTRQGTTSLPTAATAPTRALRSGRQGDDVRHLGDSPPFVTWISTDTPSWGRTLLCACQTL